MPETGDKREEVLPLWKELLALKDKYVCVSAASVFIPSSWGKGVWIKAGTSPTLIVYDCTPRFLTSYAPDVTIPAPRGHKGEYGYASGSKGTIVLSDLSTYTAWRPAGEPCTASLARMEKAFDDLVLEPILPPYDKKALIGLANFSPRFAEKVRWHRGNNDAVMALKGEKQTRQEFIF
jgi:hypothetical protein